MTVYNREQKVDMDSMYMATVSDSKNLHVIIVILKLNGKKIIFDARG